MGNIVDDLDKKYNPVRQAGESLASKVGATVATAPASTAPTENPGYTERLTGEKAALGAAAGAQNVDNSGLKVLKPGEQ